MKRRGRSAIATAEILPVNARTLAILRRASAILAELRPVMAIVKQKLRGKQRYVRDFDTQWQAHRGRRHNLFSTHNMDLSSAYQPKRCRASPPPRYCNQQRSTGSGKCQRLRFRHCRIEHQSGRT